MKKSQEYPKQMSKSILSSHRTAPSEPPILNYSPLTQSGDQVPTLTQTRSSELEGRRLVPTHMESSEEWQSMALDGANQEGRAANGNTDRERAHVRQKYIHIPLSLPKSCVTLSKLNNLSEPIYSSEQGKYHLLINLQWPRCYAIKYLRVTNSCRA